MSGKQVVVDVLDEHGRPVSHARIAKRSGVVSCKGTMRFHGYQEWGGGVAWDGNTLDRIAICADCGSEYGVETQTGAAVRSGEITREEAPA